MEAFSTGTLAGAGSFRCEDCDFAIALHEMDEVPVCPSCGGRKFQRSSMFGATPHPRVPAHEGHESPDWVEEARDALVAPGHYLAYESEERVQVVPLQDGWTRVGRSLSAHIRFDDPTVSRRHALVYCDPEGARVLDDRSLNGVFRNGERVDMEALEDGDELGVGRFRLFFMEVEGAAEQDRVPAHTATG